MKRIKNMIACSAMGAAAACAAAVPMPATTPEEIIALAHRTYEYVARSVPEIELAGLKKELLSWEHSVPSGYTRRPGPFV